MDDLALFLLLYKNIDCGAYAYDQEREQGENTAWGLVQAGSVCHCLSYAAAERFFLCVQAFCCVEGRDKT